MMNVNSYKSVDTVCFGMTKDEVFKTLGRAVFEDVNNENEESLHYENLIVRMDAVDKTVREIVLLGISNNLFILNSRSFCADDELPKALFRLDDEVLEIFGCWVFFKLGITLTGYADAGDERIITAFRKGDWDDLKPTMKTVEFD